MFDCSKCGLCCRNVYRIPKLSYLADDDGVCRYLDTRTNLCTIYEERPVLCNIDMYYDIFLRDVMTREEFYKQNKVWCDDLIQGNKGI